MSNFKIFGNNMLASVQEVSILYLFPSIDTKELLNVLQKDCWHVSDVRILFV